MTEAELMAKIVKEKMNKLVSINSKAKIGENLEIDNFSSIHEDVEIEIIVGLVLM